MLAAIIFYLKLFKNDEILNWEEQNISFYSWQFDQFPVLKGLSTLKVTYSGFKDYGLLILPLTLIFHFGETPKIGRDSGQKMCNPVTKSY